MGMNHWVMMMNRIIVDGDRDSSIDLDTWFLGVSPKCKSQLWEIIINPNCHRNHVHRDESEWERVEESGCEAGDDGNLLLMDNTIKLMVYEYWRKQRYHAQLLAQICNWFISISSCWSLLGRYLSPVLPFRCSRWLPLE